MKERERDLLFMLEAKADFQNTQTTPASVDAKCTTTPALAAFPIN